jgi:hypothetical protein
MGDYVGTKQFPQLFVMVFLDYQTVMKLAATQVKFVNLFLISIRVMYANVLLLDPCLC